MTTNPPILFKHALLTEKHACQAAIKDKSLKFFGHEVYSLKECCSPATKKVTIDDGDAFFYACVPCLAKYLTKLRAGTNWIGWFDCDIHPEARVRGSRWYWSLFLEEYNKANPKSPLAYPTPIVLNKWFSLLEQPKEKNDELQEKIEELQTWLKTFGKTANPFETMKKMKELKELKANKESL
jgi:hypothetical protein